MTKNIHILSRDNNYKLEDIINNIPENINNKDILLIKIWIAINTNEEYSREWLVIIDNDWEYEISSYYN